MPKKKGLKLTITHLIAIANVILLAINILVVYVVGQQISINLKEFKADYAEFKNLTITGSANFSKSGEIMKFPNNCTVTANDTGTYVEC